MKSMYHQFFVCLFVVVMTILTLPSVMADEPITSDVSEFVNSYVASHFSDWRLENCIVIANTPDGDYSFASVYKSGARVMLGFLEANGKQMHYLTQYDTLPQGAGEIRFIQHTANTMISQGNTDASYKDQLGFEAMFIAAENEEHPAATVDFHYRNGSFQLTAYCKDGMNEAYVTDTYVRFYNCSTETVFQKVYGHLQRDMRYMSYSALPKNYSAAEDKLTLAPDVSLGSMQTQEIQFTGGKKYAVYSAPSEGSERGANGKATVSTNDWIQVFGKENGFILIQYAVNSTHMRFGYIDATSLPKHADVSAMDWMYIDAWLLDGGLLTDDPLYSQTTLVQLPQGSKVTILATLDNWAYVEYDSDTYCRGFVDSDLLAYAQHTKLESNSEVMFSGESILIPTGELTVEITLFSPLPEGVQGLCLSTDHSLLAVFDSVSSIDCIYSIQCWISSPGEVSICYLTTDGAVGDVIGRITFE